MTAARLRPPDTGFGPPTCDRVSTRARHDPARGRRGRVLVLALEAFVAVMLARVPGPARAQREHAPAFQPEVAERVVGFYNQSGTIHLSGESTLAAGSEMVGDVAVLGGPFTLAGRIRGDLLIINGVLQLLPGAEVTGSVLIVGGTAHGVKDARIAGGVVAYPEAFRYRVENDRMEYAGPRPGALVAGRDFAFGRADFMLAAHGGYNRVEGLPVAFGPRVQLGRANPTNLEALGIYRSATGLRVDAGHVGYALRAEQYLGGWNTVRFGGRFYSEVVNVQDMGFSDRENSLATFVLHLDFRDHYKRKGLSGYVRVARRDLPWDLTFEYRDERDLSLSPHGVWAILDRTWRAQPVVAEGTLRSGAASLEYDTRNDVITPAAGWFLHAGIEHGLGGTLVYPTARSPQDTLFQVLSANPNFLTGTLDIRRYIRLGPSARMAVRALAEGSVNGRPLPPQRQLALGGAATLPGYGSFRFDCGARESTLDYPAGDFYPYYGCDRAILLQAEYQAALPLARRLGRALGFHGDLGESLGWVVFYDAGRAWTDLAAREGRGGGQDAFAADAGLGLRLERIGVYWALPLSARSQGLNFFVRVGPRL